MNNKMKRLSSVILLLVFCITCIFTGCGKKAVDASAEKKTVEIKDSKGKSVTVPRAPKKVVVMNNAVAEIIYVLGESDKIVGISNGEKFPKELSKKQQVGKAFTPDVEKILSLKPDLVLGYGDEFVKKETIEKINTAGIPYVGIDGFKIASLPKDIRTLGTIFNKKERAEEYVSFIDKYLDIVKKKVAKIEPEKKTTVYWEGYSDFKSVSKGSSGQEVIDLAGLSNIASAESVPYPKVSNEWILQKNPKMVVKMTSTSVNKAVPFGYGVTDIKAMSGERDKMMNRTGWKNIDAVKNGAVYMVSNDIATSARSIVGICYLAKWAYPDQFKDLNPEAVHKEMLEKFYKVDYKGTWICP